MRLRVARKVLDRPLPGHRASTAQRAQRRARPHRGTVKLITNGRGQLVATTNVIAWACWFERADRVVRQDHVGPYFVSTVMLGVGLGFGNRLFWFESMIFADDGDPYDLALTQRRYTSRKQALRGHAELLALATGCNTNARINA